MNTGFIANLGKEQERTLSLSPSKAVLNYVPRTLNTSSIDSSKNLVTVESRVGADPEGVRMKTKILGQHMQSPSVLRRN